MCNALLAQSDDELTTVVGDECHIAARSPGGPRYDPELAEADRDRYDNLILLCKNHHQLVDSNPQVFTVEILKAIKAEHEERIRDPTSSNPAEGFTSGVLVRHVQNGTELARIVFDAHAYSFDHPHPETDDERTAIGGLLQNVQDWGDISGEIGAGGRLDAIAHFDELLSTLQDLVGRR